MAWQHSLNRTHDGFGDRPTDDILGQARAVARKALDRLQDLHTRFPSDVPREVVAGLEQFHDGPADGVNISEVDQRAGPRFAGGWTSVTVHDPDRPAQHEGRLLDRSWGGVAILCNRPAPVGAILGVRLPDRFDAADNPDTYAEVKYCRRQGDNWVVGCQFLSP